MQKYLSLIPFLLALSLGHAKVSHAEDVFEKLFPYEFGEFEGEFEDKWQEEKLSLPAIPDDSDLIEFSGPAGYTQYRYAIDTESLNVGKDGIVRYTVVIASNSGSKNTYYQGISCTKERLKQYAYADSDNLKFIATIEPQWEGLRRTGATGYSDNLFSFYFCGRMNAALSRDDIINRLKYGQGEQDSEYY